MNVVFELLILFQIFVINAALNFFIKKYEMCDPTVNYPIKIYMTFRRVGNDQFLDCNATLDIPFSNDLYLNVQADVLIGEKYVNILTIKEGRACDCYNKYMGEFWYDIQRAAQIIPGLCPVRKGRYHIHNAHMNYNKMTLQAFPFGTIRIATIVTKKRNSDVVICLKGLIENKVF